jgi:hypothetical protein
MKQFWCLCLAAFAVLPASGQQLPALLYSTYLKGSQAATINDVAADAQGFPAWLAPLRRQIFQLGTPFSPSQEIVTCSLRNSPRTAAGLCSPPFSDRDREPVTAETESKWTGVATSFSLGTTPCQDADERPAELALDGQENVYIADTAYANTIPTANGFQRVSEKGPQAGSHI